MSVALSTLTVASQLSYLMKGRKTFGSSSVEKCILWHHGAGGEWNLWEPRANQLNLFHILESLANAGYTVLSSDFSAASWGNSTNQTRIGAAVAALAAVGCRTDRVGLIGHSMGFTCMAKWAAANTSKVAALAGLIPCTDPQWSYDNVPALQAGMNAAWGGSWATGNASTNPSLTTISSALAAAATPIRCYYATDDTTVGATTAPTFANIINAAGGVATAVASGTGAHTDTPLANVDLASWVRFFEINF